MHMADALLSPAVGAAMYGVSAISIAKAVREVDTEELGERKLPLMAVSGAFVFAAQMINFTIPGTGSSGHICGGILLSGLLGGPAALLTIASVLIIQCLIFADGGLLALGANIFNMGVIPCMIVWPLLTRPLLKKIGEKHFVPVTVASCMVGLELGALMVVAETMLSGITELPVLVFLGLMLGIHLAIGFGEGLITSAVFACVKQTRPELFQGISDDTGVTARNGSVQDGAETVKEQRSGWGKTVLLLGILAVLVGGGLSHYASEYPDGLEWSVGRTSGKEELEAEGGIYDAAAGIQEAAALLPDYDFPAGEGAGTTVSGLAGGLMTCLLAAGLGGMVVLLKRRGRAGARG